MLQNGRKGTETDVYGNRDLINQRQARQEIERRGETVCHSVLAKISLSFS